MEQTRMDPLIVQSVTRALEILETVAGASSSIGLKEISNEIDLPMPTIHRLLHTLIASGYVYQTPGRRYALGARLMSLSRYAGGVFGVALRPLIGKTVEKLGESVSVAMLDQDFARYIAHVPSERASQMFAEVGNQVSLHATAVGKVILAVMPHNQREITLSRANLRSFTSATIVDLETLRQEIALVRKRRYAVDNGEHEEDVRCVAVPVPGDIYLAVSMSTPAAAFDESKIETVIVPTLSRLARSIGRTLRERREQEHARTTENARLGVGDGTPHRLGDLPI